MLQEIKKECYSFLLTRPKITIQSIKYRGLPCPSCLAYIIPRYAVAL